MGRPRDYYLQRMEKETLFKFHEIYASSFSLRLHIMC